MIRVVLISIVVSFIAAFGAIAATTLAKGSRAGQLVAGGLLILVLVCGAAAWAIYGATKQGSLSPDDFYNSVAGNALVVGGLLAAVGAILGIAVAFALMLRQPP
jgi:hypothetical protein